MTRILLPMMLIFLRTRTDDKEEHPIPDPVVAAAANSNNKSIKHHNKKEPPNRAAASFAAAEGFNSPTKTCMHRIFEDLEELQHAPLDGIFIVLDEDRANVCHAIIIGPSDTPYENGIFQFRLEFPNDYPFDPPKVTFLTTSGGSVRFNPNLYPCGKVCLSILGTWNGPGWTSVQTMGSVLLSIQSLLSEYPYRNEPGFEDTPKSSPHVMQYNQCLRHETLRVAVLGSIEEILLIREPAPNSRLTDFAVEHFLDHVETYKYLCDEYAFLDGRIHRDVFSPHQTQFRFRSLKLRIEELEDKVRQRLESAGIATAAKNDYDDAPPPSDGLLLASMVI